MKYLISGLITDTIELSGSNINLDKSLTADQHLVLTGIGCNVSADGDIDFTANSDLRITAFRVRPFLEVVSNNKIAAELSLKFATLDSGVVGDELLGVKLRAPRLGEWVPTDIYISKQALKQAYDLTGDNNRPFTLFIKSGDIHVMDYNVQDDFNGQTLGFALDLEVEADAILDSNTGKPVQSVWHSQVI